VVFYVHRERVEFPADADPDALAEWLAVKVFRTRKMALLRLYADLDFAPVENRVPDGARTLRLMDFVGITSSVVAIALRVVFVVCENVVGDGEQRFDVLLPAEATAANLATHACECGLVPREADVRVLFKREKIIAGVLDDHERLSQRTNGFRVEIVPEEQSGINTRDLVPVVWKRKVRLEFIVEAVDGEEFVAVRRRIEEIVSEAQGREVAAELMNCRFSWVATREVIALADNMRTWRTHRRGHISIVKRAGVAATDGGAVRLRN
jgi:hypothetical protein